MLRFSLRRVSLSASRSSISSIRTGPLRRTFGSYSPELPKVPILRPTIWALAATATIYIGCATHNVYREARIVKRRGDYKEDVIKSYDDLEYVKKRGDGFRRNLPLPRKERWFPTGHLSAIQSGYTGAEIMTIYFSALNVSLFGAKFLAPSSVMPYLSHVPAFSPNYTLLTSIFGHSGLLHVSLNTFVLLQFAPRVTKSHLFQGNGNHFTAFYLSAGILSSLGHQVGTILPTRTYRFNRFAPAAESSGVIMAVIGAWATMNLNEKVGIMFLPGSYAVQDLVTFMVALDTFGLFFGLPFLSTAHAAHLSGLAFGWAYAHFDGEKKLWRPTCRSAFLLMKQLKMI
ncbi:uncharacterized protein GGS22DRAFT_132931 [Annulohypoxylon maeteangense]|uniref:uncharacterized protein n=1 Tax=Annulohypoxylon maeteangense TaxID=1927788 RepID=UPI002007CA55|nr:uncharacterized protein GGS22DRAFT_132931 [Annulohypoxylon maeteangense]KAI0885709.1 hypothetical protein GGS22DRAFT_132931 [Annulohypoxylon maeteangense]